MHDSSVIVARPPNATQLILLFHGVGSSAKNLAPLGAAIAQARPDAIVASVDGPHPSTLGSGREWFSVVGVTEENRPERVAQAMPSFEGDVREWQASTRIGVDRTVLIGFSQGSIMSLESTQIEQPLASTVIAVAGRFAEGVRQALPWTRFHLIHGEQDPVVPARWSIRAAEEIRALGGHVTLDLLPALSHEIDARVARLVLTYSQPSGG